MSKENTLNKIHLMSHPNRYAMATNIEEYNNKNKTIYASKLAEVLDCNRSLVMFHALKLKSHGLLEMELRENDKGDKAVQHFSLTSDGKDILDKINSI